MNHFGVKNPIPIDALTWPGPSRAYAVEANNSPTELQVETWLDLRPNGARWVRWGAADIPNQAEFFALAWGSVDESYDDVNARLSAWIAALNNPASAPGVSHRNCFGVNVARFNNAGVVDLPWHSGERIGIVIPAFDSTQTASMMALVME